MKSLCFKIEILRQRMHEIALNKGITHPDVLWVSQILDEVINDFYRVDWMKKAV